MSTTDLSGLKGHTFIPNALRSQTGILVSADQIIDLSTGKKQDELNLQAAKNKNIDDVINYYAVHSSTSIEEGVELNWMENQIPTMNSELRYLWNYEEFKYSDGTSSTTTPGIIGVYGQGRGVESMEYFYLVSSDGENAPLPDDENWTTISPTTDDVNKYLWQKIVTKYNDSDENSEGEVNISLVGVHGTPGMDGVDGKDGSSVEYIYCLYDATTTPDENGKSDPYFPTENYPVAADNQSNDSISEKSQNDGWKLEPVSVTTDKPYLWMSMRKKPQGNIYWGEYSVPTLWAVYGKSILNTESKYLTWSTTDEPTYDWDDELWKSYSPATDDTNKYLWKWTKTSMTGGDVRDIKEIIGIHGDRGMDGSNIEYIYKLCTAADPKPTIEYGGGTAPDPSTGELKEYDIYDATLNEFVPKGWSDEPVDVDPENPYLFMSRRKKAQGSNMWDNFSDPTLWAVYGKSVLSVESKYQINNDKNNAPAGGWDDEVWLTQSPAVTNENRCLWKLTRTTLTGGDFKDVCELVGVQGDPGVDGTNIEYIYKLSATEETPSIPAENEAGNTNTNVTDFIPKGWSDEPQDVSPEFPFQYMSSRKFNQTENKWDDFIGAKLWSVYGKSVIRIEKLYQISSKSDLHPDTPASDGNPFGDGDAMTGPDKWSEKSPAVTDGQPYLWEKTITYFTGGVVNEPIYAVVGVKGTKGTDAEDIEYIYKLTETYDKPLINVEQTPTGAADITDENGQQSHRDDIPFTDFGKYKDLLPIGWTDEPGDVSEDMPYQWYSYRKFNRTSNQWNEFSTPILWSKFGADGAEGNGILEVIKKYCVASTNDWASIQDNKDINWVDNSPATDGINKYLWCHTTTKYSGDKEDTSTYELIGTHGDRGIDAASTDYIYALSNQAPTEEFKAILVESLAKIQAPLSEPVEVENQDFTWTDDPQDVSDMKQYLYMATASSHVDVNNERTWSAYGDVVLWSKYGSDGNGVESINISYAISAYASEQEMENNIDGWTWEDMNWTLDTPAVTEDFRYLWRKTVTTYQKALVDDESTEEDETKKRQKVTYEMIGAMGERGIDGAGLEYIYILTQTDETPYIPPTGKGPKDTESHSNYESVEDFIPDGWADDMVMRIPGEDGNIKEITLSAEYPYAWRAQRKYNKNTGKWGYFTEYAEVNGEIVNTILPKCVARHGVDGRGITQTVYTYNVSSAISFNEDGSIYPDPDTIKPNEDDVIITDPKLWPTSSPAVDDTYKYLWRHTEVFYNDNTSDTLMELIGEKGEKGIDGADIEYAYMLKDKEETPEKPTTDPGQLGNPNGVDIELDKWFDDPQDVSDDHPYLYMCIGKKVQGGSWEWDTPMLWAKYGKDATILLSSENWYGVGASGNGHDDIDAKNGWQKTSPSTTETERFLWKKSVKVYSKKFEGGQEGSLDDETKQYTVTEYDMIGIAGQKGVDGSSSDYIYVTTVDYSNEIKAAISKAATDYIEQDAIPLNGTKTVTITVGDKNIDLKFTDDPDDVTEEVPYLWILQASYDNTTSQWSKYGNAHLWSKYGSDGTLLLHSENWYGVNNSPNDYDGIEWQETSPGTDENNRYLWKKSIKLYSKEIAVPDQEGIESGTDDNGRFQLVEYDMIGVAGEKGVDGTKFDYAYIQTKTYDDKNIILEALKNQGTLSPGKFGIDTPTQSVTFDYNGKNYTVTFHDDAPEVTSIEPYLWLVQSDWVETNGVWGWGPYGKLTLWAKYGVDGSDGNGILEINTSYLISSVSTLDELVDKEVDLYEVVDATEKPNLANKWYDNSPELTSDNRYLWKRTKTIYAKETTGTINNGNAKEDYKWEMIGSIGKDGLDGAGSEWAYYLTNEDGKNPSVPVGTITDSPTGEYKTTDKWMDDPQGVDKDHRYEWMSKRSKIREKVEADGTVINYGAWGEWSKPSLYARYSKDGIGIKESTAFFLSTNSLIAPNAYIDYNDTTSDPDSSDPKTYNKYKELLRSEGWVENRGSANKESRFLYEVQLVAYGEADAAWTGDETDLNFDIFGPNNIGGYATETRPNFLRNSDFESVSGWKCEIYDSTTKTTTAYDISSEPTTIKDTLIGIYKDGLRNDSGKTMKYFKGENPYYDAHYQDLLVNEVVLQPDTWYTMSAYLKADTLLSPSNRMSFIVSCKETGKQILVHNDDIFVDGISSKIADNSLGLNGYDNYPTLADGIINRSYKQEAHIDFELTNDWRRHYITFKTAPADLFQAPDGICKVIWRWDGNSSFDPDTTTSEATTPMATGTPSDVPSKNYKKYVTGCVGMPKFEASDLVTPWCKTEDEQAARTLGAIEEYYKITNDAESWGNLPAMIDGENDAIKSNGWYFDDSDENAVRTPYYHYNPGTIKPHPKDGKYLWNMEVIRYDQGDTKDVYIETLTPQLIGSAAVGIASTEKKYLISNSNTINPYPSNPPAGYSQYPSITETKTPWLDNSPAVTNEHPFLWERTIIKYEDDTTTTPKVICLGSKGVDSKTIEYIYCATAVENTGIKDPNSGKAAAGTNVSSKESDGFIPEGWLDDNPGTSVTNKYIYQSYREKSAPNTISGGVANYVQTWGAFSTPKLIATYAINQIFADLDNEMDSVPCNHNGIVSVATTITTNVNMYEGSDKITLTKISIEKDGLEVTPTVSGQGTKDGKVEVVLPINTKLSKDRYNIKIELQATDSKNTTQTKQLNLTINVVKAGQDGTPGKDSEIYQLVPSITQITRSNSGITSPDSVYCNVNKIVGSTTSTDMPTSGKIKYSIDGATEVDYTRLTDVKTNNINKNIKFVLYDSLNNVLDTETIALAKSALNPGVNLIDNSSFRDGDKHWVVNNGNVNDQKYTYTSAANSSAETSMLIYNNDGTFTFKPNTWYTISFSYKGNVGTYNTCPSMLRVLIKNTVNSTIYTIGDYSAGMYINGNPVTITNNNSVITTIDGIKYIVSANSTSNGTSCTCPSYNGTDWNTFSLTFKTKGSLNTNEPNSKIYFLASPKASDINIKQIKLEEGKEATGWDLSTNDKVGRGVKSKQEYYKLSNSNTSSPAPNDSWSTGVLQTTYDNKYLWNYEKTTYTDDSTITTAPVVISTYNKEPIQLIIDKPVITCPIDPDTKQTISDKTYTVYIRLMQGGEYLDINDYILSCIAYDEDENEIERGSFNNGIWETPTPITYTTTDGSVINPAVISFGANIVSNKYSGGTGTISFDGPITNIPTSAFTGNTKLKTITIPGCVSVINNGAFANCSSLASVTFSGAPQSTNPIRLGNSIFLNCSSLANVKLNIVSPSQILYVSSMAGTFTNMGSKPRLMVVGNQLSNFATAGFSNYFTLQGY